METVMDGVLGAILEVFTGVGSWLSQAVNSMIPMFYVAETGLTFVGVLAVAGLAISVAFLLINVISNFLSFRA